MLQQGMLSSPDSIAYHNAIGGANTCAHGCAASPNVEAMPRPAVAIIIRSTMLV